MRTLMLLLGIICLPVLLAGQEYQIYSSKSGKYISLETMAKELGKYDVIFFGEFHGNPGVHKAQRELLPLLYDREARLILSFEMFERDTQTTLDAYLGGKISEAEFLAAARPWSNYETDYKPLLEFAKSRGLVAIAANIPRRLAGSVVRNGKEFLDELGTDDKVLMALQISAPKGKYRDRFFATMQANGTHGDSNDEELYELLYFAQCMKDDTMAESLAQYVERYPKYKIIHFNGDFHSREFLGTVERLAKRNKKLKIAVISPLLDGEPIPAKPKKVANYLLIVQSED
jgi:uncharacterized iron-regulated protein